MQIGIDARRALGKRGMDRYVRDLLIHLSKFDNQNKYILFTNEGLPKLCLGANFHRETLHPRFRMIHRKYVSLLRRKWFKNIDVFHFPTSDIWYSKFCKTIVTLHDLAPLRYPNHFFLDKREFLKYQEHLLYIKKNADIIITVSNYSKKDIISGLNIPENKIRVIYQGVNPSLKKSSKQYEGMEVLKKYQILNDFILYVGGLDFRKNIGTLLKSFKLFIPETNLPYVLVIVGKIEKGRGDFYPPLAKLAKEFGIQKKVIFTGWVSDEELVILYRNAALFAFPSLIEGFGFPPLEAMACGTPVIASNTTALPEILGDAAILVNPLNPKEIANTMAKVLNNEALRSNLVNKGLMRARLFLWEETARKTLEVYDEVAKSS